jgi:hypothetical protein
LGVCVAAVVAHNFARFGNVLEFGQDYQLSGEYESKMRYFSLAYVPHNAYTYFFHPGIWSLKFPFVSSLPVPGGPSGYLGGWAEAICGLGVTFPYVWMVLALPLAMRAGPNGWRLRATIESLLAFCAVMCLAILSFYCATVRYLADFAPTLGLAAACGWLGLERWAKEAHWTKVVTPLTVLACAATAVAGVLVSFDYHRGMLQRLSPGQWESMRDFFARFGL